MTRPETEGAAPPEDQALAELRERAQRAIADADNARKRAGRQRIAAAWLPVLDNLDLALRHAGADPEAIVQAVARAGGGGGGPDGSDADRRSDGG